MAEYPAHLVRHHVLSDGRTVTVRPIQADDARLERCFLRDLSDESRYLRFQKAVRAPSEQLIHFLTDVDYERHMALVCTVARDGGEELAGEARYVADTQGTSCEFGIMIGDRWRNSGIAGLLMAALLRAAEERGIEIMEGQVLTTNWRMLRFARALGFAVEPMPGDPGTRHIVKRLLRTRARGSCVETDGIERRQGDDPPS
jgi:acetyltransferase